MAFPPFLPVFGRSKSSSFRVTANGINVNEVYEMHIYHAVLWVPFSRLLYYPVMNTVSRVITTNASASWNKRQFFPFQRYILCRIYHARIAIFFITFRIILRISTKKSCQLEKKHDLVIHNQLRL